MTGGGRGFRGEVSAEEKELKALGVEAALQGARMPAGDEAGPVGFTTLSQSSRLRSGTKPFSLPHVCDPRGQKGHGLVIWWSPGLGVAILSRCPTPPLVLLWGFGTLDGVSRGAASRMPATLQAICGRDLQKGPLR